MSCEGNCGSCTSCKEQFHEMPLNQTEFIYDPITYSKPGRVFLGVTARCNLSCPYCFVDQHNTDMSFETACNAIELMFKHHKEANYDFLPEVIFFGGEPMLRFEDLIKPLIEKYGDKIGWNMTTNGTLMNEDAVDWCYEHGLQFMLSWDGVKEVQDYQRPGKCFSSYDKLIHNVPYMLVRFPDLTVRMTITKHSIPYLYETYSMFKEFGIEKILCGVNSFEEWTENEYKLCVDQLKKIGAEMFYDILNEYEYPLCIFESLIETVQKLNLDARSQTYFYNSLIRCGTGTTTFSVCPDGRIVPCQEKISNPTWVIGDVNNEGINSNKHNEFLSWYWENINKSQCTKKCPFLYQHTCMMDICPSRCEDLNFVKSSADCYYIRALVDAAAPLKLLMTGNINVRMRTILDENLQDNLLYMDEKEIDDAVSRENDIIY